jgi:hypothetical protein
MKAAFASIAFTILFGVGAEPVNAQAPGYDPVASISADLSRIASSVKTLNTTLTEFVEKFAKVPGISLSEKQQRLIMGLEILVKAEQRLATLQKFQIELVEKEGTVRSRLAQVENDMRPQNIERSVAFEGSTAAPEMKESRRQMLYEERMSLTAVLQQIQSNLNDATNNVREAQAQVQRLRRMFLPQIERELAEPER